VVVAALGASAPEDADRPRSPQPLTFERWTFVLDGSVPGFRREHTRALRNELPDDLYAELRGSSDSETLFLLAVTELRRAASMPDALARRRCAAAPFADGGVVVASEAPDPGAVWAAVDGHSWMEVDAAGSIRSDLLFLG